MPRIWAKTVTYESIQVGDQLPILVKWDTPDTMAYVNAVALGDQRARPKTGGPAGKKTDQSEPVALSGPALVAYVTELLEKTFPIKELLGQKSRVEVEHILPILADDTVTFTGEVVGKREELREVECAIIVENQKGETVARATAVVRL